MALVFSGALCRRPRRGRRPLGRASSTERSTPEPAPYLRALSLIYLPLALVLVVDNYQLALGRARFIALYFAGAFAEWVVFVWPGGTPWRLVWVLAAASGACFIWGLVILLSARERFETPV